MNEQSISLLVTKVEELIRACGGKIEAFFPYCVKQAFVAGVLSSIGIGIAILSLIIALYILLNKKIPKIIDHEYVSAPAIAMIILFIVSVVSLAASTVGNVTFLALFNPEFYATKILISLIR